MVTDSQTTPKNQSLPFHPVADQFPLTEGDEFAELVGDIKRRGLLVPITVFKEPIPRADGSFSIQEMRTVIIDGRNRARACAKAGVTPQYVEFDGDADDIPRYIISMNIHRRHLKTERRRELLVKLLQLHPEMSDRAIAAEAGVSHTAVQKARKATGNQLPVGKRTGKDGRTRRMPTLKQKPAPSTSQSMPACEEVTADEAIAVREAQAKVMQDIGENSSGEVARLRTRIEEQDNEIQRLRKGNIGLQSEIEEQDDEIQWLKKENVGLRGELEELRKTCSQVNVDIATADILPSPPLQEMTPTRNHPRFFREEVFRGYTKLGLEQLEILIRMIQLGAENGTHLTQKQWKTLEGMRKRLAELKKDRPPLIIEGEYQEVMVQ
jgi:ParB-like nuclease domain